MLARTGSSDLGCGVGTGSGVERAESNWNRSVLSDFGDGARRVVVGAGGLANIEDAIRGSLFARDFVCESIVESADWTSVDDVALDALERSLTSIFEAFPYAQAPNESQTEDDLIWPFWGSSGGPRPFASKTSPPAGGQTCLTACSLPTTRRSAAPTSVSRKGSDTSTASPWWSRSVGSGRLTGGRGIQARGRHHRRRCSVTCGERMI